MFDKEFDDIRFGAGVSRSHLFSKLVVKLRLQIARSDLTEQSWFSLCNRYSQKVNQELDSFLLEDSLNVITGELNFRGFMQHYWKDLINHYRLEFVDSKTAYGSLDLISAMKGEILEQLLTQVEVFCKVYSCLELVLNFNPDSFSKSVAKYISRNEFTITLQVDTDFFEWDLLSNNNPEEFALVYCRDKDLQTTDFVRVEQTIRLQIQSFLYFRYYQVARTILCAESLAGNGPTIEFIEGTLILYHRAGCHLRGLQG